MKTLKSSQKTITKTVLALLFSIALGHQTAQAADKLTLDFVKSVKVKKFAQNVQVRGYNIAQGVYMGHTKVAGKYGFGVVVDRTSFSWAINNRGLSIQKSF